MRSATNTIAHERRRTSRFPLGLPVKLHLGGRREAFTVELVDISAGGARFRLIGAEVHRDQHAAFAFVMPDQRLCVAHGRIVRVDGAGQFAVQLSDVNDAFSTFVSRLS